MAFHYSPKITTSGLRTYLDPANTYSYSGTGINWYDHARSGASGSLTAGFAYDAASKSFYAATATASTAAWITITPTVTLADLSQYSLEFSVRLRPNAPTSPILSLCGNGSSQPIVGIAGSTASWNMFFRDAGATYSNSSTITYYNASNWMNLCYTFDSARTVRFYLNGSLISATSSANTSLNISRIAGGYSATGPIYYPFMGYFSAFKIYDKTLSPSEVLRNHLALAPRFGIS